MAHLVPQSESVHKLAQLRAADRLGRDYADAMVTTQMAKFAGQLLVKESGLFSRAGSVISRGTAGIKKSVGKLFKRKAAPGPTRRIVQAPTTIRPEPRTPKGPRAQAGQVMPGGGTAPARPRTGPSYYEEFQKQAPRAQPAARTSRYEEFQRQAPRTSQPGSYYEEFQSPGRVVPPQQAQAAAPAGGGPYRRPSPPPTQPMQPVRQPVVEEVSRRPGQGPRSISAQQQQAAAQRGGRVASPAAQAAPGAGAPAPQPTAGQVQQQAADTASAAAEQVKQRAERGQAKQEAAGAQKTEGKQQAGKKGDQAAEEVSPGILGTMWRYRRPLAAAGAVGGMYGLARGAGWAARQLEHTSGQPLAYGAGWSPVPYGYGYTPYGPGVPTRGPGG